MTSFSSDRRALLAASLTLSACATTPEAPSACGALSLDAAIQDSDPDEIIPLWPNGPPGAANVTVTEQVIERPNDLGLRDRIAMGVTLPTLSVFRPAHPDGSALLIIPGGGYRHVVIDKEGYEAARWYASRGATCFVLRYRQPYDHWAAGPEAPLQDAQRAMRVVRSTAQRFGFDPARVAALGFSAGGHVTASLAIRYDQTFPADSDQIDQLPAQPAITALMYPVITMGAARHVGSRNYLLGETPSDTDIARYSLEQHAHAAMTPMLLVHAADDESVPVANSMMMFEALGAAGVKRELHVFEEGRHGFSVRFARDKPVRVWPDLVRNWGQKHGVFGAPAPA